MRAVLREDHIYSKEESQQIMQFLLPEQATEITLNLEIFVKASLPEAFLTSPSLLAYPKSRGMG